MEGGGDLGDTSVSYSFTGPPPLSDQECEMTSRCKDFFFLTDSFLLLPLYTTWLVDMAAKLTEQSTPMFINY